jgi:hypothetical protein
MVAHLNIPALDSRKGIPSTLSERIITDLLQDELKFEGLVITDALNMGGIANEFSPGEMDLKALKAGNDILLFPGNVPSAVKLIRKEMRKNPGFQEKTVKKVKKILKAKYQLGLTEFEPLSTVNLYSYLNNERAGFLNRKFYEKAITLARNEGEILPVKILDTAYFASLNFGNVDHTQFQQSLDRYARFAHFGSKELSGMEPEDALKKLSRYSYVCVRFAGMNNSGSKNYGLKPEEIDFVRKLSLKTNVIVTVFGNPYSLKNFSGFESVICAYSDHPFSQQSVPQAIFGAIPFSGKLPVSSGSFKEGEGVVTKTLGRLGYSHPLDVRMDPQSLNRIDD